MRTALQKSGRVRRLEAQAQSLSRSHSSALVLVAFRIAFAVTEKILRVVLYQESPVCPIARF